MAGVRQLLVGAQAGTARSNDRAAFGQGQQGPRDRLSDQRAIPAFGHPLASLQALDELDRGRHFVACLCQSKFLDARVVCESVTRCIDLVAKPNRMTWDKHWLVHEFHQFQTVLLALAKAVLKKDRATANRW